jgi:hypothetical protein
MKPAPHIILLVLFTAITANIAGQNLGFSGQFIGWSTVNPAEPFMIQGGLRYIPEIQFSQPIGTLTLEGEASFNIWGTADYNGSAAADTSLGFGRAFDPYRLWIKLSGNRFEFRAGLQKINFGSARMLRPLMWFDKIDPRDPLQLTDGVYGLLGRYYFLNNANIWLWGLYGNDQRKGLEQFPTIKQGFEYGGRFQVPVEIGEAALSAHHRKTDPDALLPDSLKTGVTPPETRIAFDTKLDLILGLWFEASISRHNFDPAPMLYTTMLSTGMDYTFNLGNGLNIMAEGFFLRSGETPASTKQSATFVGTTLSYPINIIHNVSAILFYDPANNNLYSFMNWSMTYDKWSFYAMAFCNPKNYQLYNFQQETSLFAGTGFQIMAVFNH